LRSGLTRWAIGTAIPLGLEARNYPLTILIYRVVLDDGDVSAQDHLHGLHPARGAERGKLLMHIGGISFERADHENDHTTDPRLERPSTSWLAS
jgi:hypothetical protein